MKIFGFLLVIMAWAELDKGFQVSELFWLLLGIAIILWEELIARVAILFRRNHNE